jgi:diguanylate cyclase (GGDEF)-like protein
MPVIYQTRFKGVVYLENNLSDNVFTSERLEILNILSSQAAISIGNARLYQNMEENVRERTAQLDKANERLRELSFHDPLTDLYNRRYTFEYISDKISSFIQKKFRHMRNEEKRGTAVEDKVLGILLLDIDHFKEVNDTYGHSAGDIALISISKVLKQMIRSDDYLVRWGGEEFLIILYNTKPDYLKRFSYRVIETVKKTPIRIADNEIIHKTCSLGYTEMPLDNVNPGLLNLEQMINLSDYALYRAKEAGRNCAAHLVINKRLVTKDDFIKCMTNPSKTTKVNEEYLKIEFIKTIEE